ncbi:MAG TPA: hypothetical protein VF759_03295 [Allosphingosinicella sp.]|jgi:hypothetical protein
MEIWLAGLLGIAAVAGLRMAACEPVQACADGSAHLAMGCSSISL